MHFKSASRKYDHLNNNVFWGRLRPTHALSCVLDELISIFSILFAEGALNNDYHMPDSLELKISRMPAVKDGKTVTKKPKSVAGAKQTSEPKDREKGGQAPDSKPLLSIPNEDSIK